MVKLAPPVGPDSRYLLPGSDFASNVVGKNDPDRVGSHLGCDFQPAVRGKSDPIFWMEPGTILRIVRNRVQGSSLASLYAGHTGNAVEWKGDITGVVWSFRHMPQWAMKNLKVGGRARMGQIATYMGTTGRSNGVHLHLGARLNGRFVDPEPILRDYGAWPLQNDYYKPKPVVVKPTPAPEPPKEWSDMATKEEIAEVFEQKLIDVLNNKPLIPWVDSKTGESKKFSIVDALKYGLPPQTTIKAVETALTDLKLVRWVDSKTGESKKFSIADALYYGESINWNREMARDKEHELATATEQKPSETPDQNATDDQQSQPALPIDPVQSTPVAEPEPVQPTPSEPPSN